MQLRESSILSTRLILGLRRSRLYALLSPAIVVVALSLPGITQGDFRTDSHVYVAVVLEMIRSGDWIHPMQGNVPYHNKPPLSFWLVAPFVAVMGPTLLAVRIAMICIAACCATAVTGLCRELVSTRIAVTAGLVFALTHEVFRYTHAFSMDLPLTLFMVLSVWCVVRCTGLRGAGLRSRSTKPAQWMLIGGVAMGLALMVKPLLALTILIPLAIWLVLIGRAKMIAWMGMLVVVALVVALPWHVEMVRAYPDGSGDSVGSSGSVSGNSFIDTYILSQSIDRLSTSSSQSIGHVTEPWWYYFSELAQSYLPWIVFLVGGLIWVIVRRSAVTKHWRADLLAILWFVFWISMMSMSSGKSMRYLVPAYPAMAIFVAGVLVNMPPRGRLTPVILPWIMLGVGICGFALTRMDVVQIHSPAPESRAQLFDYLDDYSRDQSNVSTGEWPALWIAPDQLRTAAHFSIHRGVHPFVATKRDVPQVGELMLYRTKSDYIPRPNDTVLDEFGVWIVTRIESAWDDGYTKK
jgi:4-amino-4-deoxy-L-arabinose transferase-like glycosyltransferase